ncbi:CoA-transferase [Mycolicibacterium litorale]|uniref:CoA-transferase n=1 Tax=Mycolicibacterium litorale TaxID=758802 RepID=UPI003CF72CD2
MKSSRVSQREIPGPRPRTITAAEAAMLITDGVTVAGDGFGMMGVADEVYAAIEERFLTSHSPVGITLVHTSGQSNKLAGITRFAYPGLLKRVVGAHWGRTPKLSQLIVDNEVEGVCLPQGQLAALYRAAAARRPGMLSTVGLNTFVDPRLDGGRVNELAFRNIESDEYVGLVSVGQQEYLLYKAITPDIGIIRGSRVDVAGNVSQEKEAAGLDTLSVAQATRNSGGLVIVQAEEIVPLGAIDARDVTVPGALVDYVVPCTDVGRFHRQTDMTAYDPRLVTGSATAQQLAAGVSATPVDPVRLAIGRRAVSLVHPGDVINAGTGIPGDSVGPALFEAGLLDKVTMTVESGVYGGIPLGGLDFGAAYNPSAIISHAHQFDFYNGGGVDIAFMGVGEITSAGDVNVSKFGGRVTGVGGFLDILDRAKRVCFLLDLNNGRRKIVDEVEHLTFHGATALDKGQEVYLITESFILRLRRYGWELHDVADRATAQRDLAALATFSIINGADARG